MTTEKTIRKPHGGKFFSGRNIFIFLMLLYPLANFLVFYVVVNFNSVLMAFQSTDEDFNAVFSGFANFRRVFETLGANGYLFQYAGNSLFFFGITLVIGFPLNMLFAYMFYMRMPGTPFFRFCLLLPAMVSGLVTAMLYSKFATFALPPLFKEWFGVETVSLLKDTRYNRWFLVLYQLFIGFSSNVIIYTNAMNQVDDSAVEAARVDGASNLRILTQVVMPIIYPTIVTFMVTGVSALFSGDASAYLFYEYSAPQNITTVGYYIFRLSKDSASLDYSFAAAIGLVFTLITFPLTMLVKYLLDRIDPMREAA